MKLKLLPFCFLFLAVPTYGQNTGLADLHNSALYRLFATNNPQGLANTNYPVNLKAIHQLNTKLMVFSMGIPRFSMQHPDTVTLPQVLSFLKKFRKHVSSNYPDFQFIDDQPDDHHKIRWMLALEGTHLLNGQLHWVDSLYQVGVRMIGIGHWFHNHFIVNPNDTAYQNRAPEMINDQSVLSPKGKALIEKLIRKKIWLDVSHLRRRVFEQVATLNRNRTPLIASHSNAYGVCPNTRNLTNDQIKVIVASGGLIGVCLHQPLIANKTSQANLKKLVDHIEYLIKVAGAKHIAIGTDLEGLIRPPKSLSRLEHLPKIAQEMKKRGMSQTTIEAVMWRNVLRVLGRK